MPLAPRRKKKLSMTSVTSAMSDMAMLLLIFFMTATTIVTEKVEEIDVPTATADNIDQNHIYIAIDAEQNIIFKNKIISKEELERILFQKKDTVGKKIVILADKSLLFGAVSDILQIAKSLNLLDIVFISRPES